MPGLRLALFLVPLLLSACTGGTADPPEEGTGEGGFPMVITDFAFSPDSLTVPPGSIVALALTNEGETRHNFSVVTVDVSQDVEPGASGRVTFQLPESGSLAFFCKYHPGQMTGTVGVENAPSDQGPI